MSGAEDSSRKDVLRGETAPYAQGRPLKIYGPEWSALINKKEARGKQKPKKKTVPLRLRKEEN